MKGKILILGIILGLVSVYSTHAQLDKAEAKEWKKKKKFMSIEEFKDMSEENSSLKGQINSLNGQIAGLQSKISDKDAKISELNDNLASLKAELEASKPAAQVSEGSDSTSTGGEEGEGGQQVAGSDPNMNKFFEGGGKHTRVSKGVVFKVQIGAYKSKDLSKFFDKGDMFSGEVSGDGVQKYTLGNFKDYWEADTFKKYMREMGVKDAWIVPFKDGVRVPMKDVLEGVI